MRNAVRGGRRHSKRCQRQPGAPHDARGPVREAEGLREAPLPSRPPASPDATHGTEGIETVRTHLLGRGVGRGHHTLERHYRRVRPAGDNPLQLFGPSGLGARVERGRRFLQPHGRHRLRAHILRRRLVHGLAAHRGRDRGRRSGELHSLEVHCHLGVQQRQHQSAPLGDRQGCSKGRRQGRRDRRLRLENRQGSRLAYLPEARNRRGARHGRYQFHHRAGLSRRGLCRELHGRLRCSEGTRRDPDAGMGSGHHWRPCNPPRSAWALPWSATTAGGRPSAP